jgi:hypothetical protein
MLVSVNQDLWLRPRDICVQPFKPKVNFIIPIMNSPWGIVRQKDMDRWKSSKKFLHFRLIIEKVPVWFVPVRSVHAAEIEVSMLEKSEM